MGNWGLVLNPVSDPLYESSSELNANDGVTYRIKSIGIPRAPKKTVYAGSFDTEGSEPADEHHYDNGTMTVELWVQGSSNATAEAAARALKAREAQFNRERGSIALTFPSGELLYVDVVEAEGAETWDWVATHRFTIAVTLRYVCKPFGRETEIGDVTDNFSTNSISKYTFDSGSGTLSVSGGQLVPSSTGSKQFYRSAEGRRYYDFEQVFKVRTGASVASWRIDLGKRIDSTNGIILLGNQSSGLTIRTLIANSSTVKSGIVFPLSTNTDYWFLFRIEGNTVYVAIFTAAPTPTSTPAASTSFTLTGSDATAFGRGVAGDAWVRFEPQGTDWRGDDLAIRPEVKTNLHLGCEPIYGIGGDVRALTRMILDELSGADQYTVWWGLQNDPDLAATAGPFYEAETRLKMGGAVTAAVASASGGNVARQSTLTPRWQAMLSTDQSGGGSPLTHVGEYRVLVRVMRPASNLGDVSLRWEYAIGDWTSVTRNDQEGITLRAGDPQEGQWEIVDLGPMDIKRIPSGAHEWEGRLVVRSTVAGDDLDVDWIALVPADLYAELTSLMALDSPTSFSARDEFSQTAGALTGKTLPAGGTWTVVAGSDADDYNVSGTGQMTRTAVSDSAPRMVSAGTTAYGNVAAAIDVAVSAFLAGSGSQQQQGVAVRIVDINNFLAAILSNPLTVPVRNSVEIVKWISGTPETLASIQIPRIVGQSYSVVVTVDIAGRWGLWWAAAGGVLSLPVASGLDPDLATGGALATGKVSPYDRHGSPQAVTRLFDNFAVWSPVGDPVLCAGRQLEIASSYAQRLDSAGAVWSRRTPSGNHLRLPPAGPEGRASRVQVLSSRGARGMADPANDAQRAQFLITPRVLL